MTTSPFCRCTSEAQGRFFAAHFGIEYKEFIEILSLEDSFFSLKLAIDPAIPRRVSVADLFTKILDINAEPPAEMLASLANYVDESECKQMLEKLAREEDFRREWLEQTGVCVRTIFEQFPTLSTIHNRDKTVGVRMFQDILLQIPKLRARFYSVSSAPDVCGNARFALTVGRLVYRSADNARINLGFCSDFIATLSIGTNVTVEAATGAHVQNAKVERATNNYALRRDGYRAVQGLCRSIDCAL